MTRLLIAEDDERARGQLAALLRLHEYEVAEAADGAQALQLVRAAPPDAIVADIGMPGLDGFELVAALRADPALAAIPVLLLTGLHDRASMRRGMQAGADDFLAKPVQPGELLEALNALLHKKRHAADRFEQALRERLAAWRRHWTAATGTARRTEQYGLAAGARVAAQRQVEATVLFADIRNFTALAQRLGSADVAELLAAWFEHACRPVLADGGSHLKFIGDGFMSLFTAGDRRPDARRAVSAALGIALAAHQFRQWLHERFAGLDLPPFAIGVGLHAGEVTLCRLGPGEGGEVSAIGDAVNVAARLEAASKPLGWTVVASRAVLDRAGEGVQSRARAALALRGRAEPIAVAEVTGLLSGEQEREDGVASLDGRSTLLRTAVEVNSALAAAAPGGSAVEVVAPLRPRRRGR
jgi:class 3 adenylate cyclase